MSISGGSRTAWRNARNTALSRLGSASKSTFRIAIASANACSDSLWSRVARRRLSSQMSGGRKIQSHSAVSSRNSTRRSRKGERENSPNRICLRMERTKSATSHNGRICSPSRSLCGFRPGRQCQKNQELHRNDGLKDQRQSRLQPDDQEQRHHREPLPSRTPQSFYPPGKPQQIAESELVPWRRRHGGTNTCHGKKASQDRSNQHHRPIHRPLPHNAERQIQQPSQR